MKVQRKTQDPRIAEKVIEMVAAHFHTTPDVVRSEGGSKSVKYVVMYVLKHELGSSLRVAQEAVNVKSAPTVYTAIKSVTALLATDGDLRAKIEEIKAEVLMITTALGGKVPGDSAADTAPVSPPTKESGEPKDQPARVAISTRKPKPTASQPVGSVNGIVGKVQRAVSSVFLGADLLQNPNATTEVQLAKDAVVFLVWDDSPNADLTETLNTLHLDTDGFHKAIGRISVCLREKDGGRQLRKKLKAARAAYAPLV